MTYFVKYAKINATNQIPRGLIITKPTQLETDE